ncbi:hypothetical protein FHS85_002315 [Rhodoligotrophos appendicifer]|uniref:DUF1223 domain-containing protein n=1 Tax=Rhodoligotrophos appendicifer TaxID=987056 RepID=UPI0014795A2D|nr:DUF1223 domain-containing protein [Rhodoligotrophos appendicifer]
MLSNAADRWKRATLTAAAVGWVLLGASATAAAEERAVVELFTSQGCSACPAADNFMKDLAKRPDVVALTFNVDYWDYLGWKDTLGNPENTKRQREYAKRRGDKDVYTPQMVIDGLVHVVGSRRHEVDALIKKRLADETEPEVPLVVRNKGRELEISVGVGPEGKPFDATVWLMMIQPEAHVAITKGENIDREIIYTNVVRKMIPVGMWHGSPMSVTLPAAELVSEEAPNGVVLLQEDDGGPIIAASAIVDLTP